MITQVARWELDHDPAITASCYSRSLPETPCQCTDCRNFRAAIDQAFPPAFAELAYKLGIDLSKPAEISHVGDPGQPIQTMGWFHIVGIIRSGRDAWVQTGPQSWWLDGEPAFGLKALGATSRIALLPDAFKEHPVIQLEFETMVPWVLEE